MSADLDRKLRLLIALRLLVVVSIAGPYALARLSAGEEPTEAMVSRDMAMAQLAFIAFSQTLVYIVFLKILARRATLHAYLQFGGDVVLITYLILRLENSESFSILYLIVISVASLMLRRSAGIVVATFAALCITAMLWTPSTPLLERVQQKLKLERTAFNDLPPTTRIYSQSVHMAGFYLMAILSSYLARNITRVEERLKAKQIDLAYLEVVHRDIIQSISSGLVTTDLRGVVMSLNKSGEKMFDRKSEDLVGLHVTETDLFDPELWQQLTEMSSDGAARTEIVRHTDGRTAHLGLTLSHLRDGTNERRGYILLVEDLTQERELQEQLRLKDRMAAVGEMATKLAHEVGNPLAAISGSVQVLAGSVAGDSSQKKLLDITLKESQRLDRTVKSFLRLAGSRERRFTDVDIAALLAEDVELLRMSGEVGPGHTIETDFDPASAVIRADRDQIGQIFWNLARNALHAMPRDGTLKVVGRLGERSYHAEFHDTGTGMSDEAKADLFHPFKSFFDQGTGIGMAIVYRIVEEHGGEIRVLSRSGRGTVIHVELPIKGPSVEESHFPGIEDVEGRDVEGRDLPGLEDVSGLEDRDSGHEGRGEGRT